jgi:pimeloyl-ACP methyl ester carboxylesterase
VASRRLLAAGLLLLSLVGGAAGAWGQAVEEDGPRPAPPSTRPADPPANRAPDGVEEDGERRDSRRSSPETRPDRRDAADTSDPVRVDAPKRTIILIFNHGTRRPQVRHVCRRGNDIPRVVKALATRPRWRVHYLCSRAIDGGDQGSYTYKRAREIERVVDAYRAKGVPAAHIFLVGHSAGGWSSLIAARRFGAKFNAVIAFAPAFAGPRHEARQYPWWRGKIRPRQVTDILQARRLRALVFAYPDDAFNRPRELAFLKRLPGVDLVTFDRCPERGHGTTYSDCFAREAAPRIERYIRARLAARP